MAESVERRTVKICLFGEAGVGKTSLIRRYVENQFDDKYITTIGTKVSKKKITAPRPEGGGGVEFTMMIWDIMGQKGFRKLLQEAYFDGANAAIGIADITQKASLEDLEKWIEAIYGVTGPIPIVVLANKSDLPQHAFGEEEMKTLINKYSEAYKELLRSLLVRGKKPYMKASAKNGENVEPAFQTIAEALV